MNLETTIYDYLAKHNAKPKPFTWTKRPKTSSLGSDARWKLDEIRGNR